MAYLLALPISEFWIFLQVLVRFSALIVIAPIFGASQVPAQVKIWITLVLSAVVTPIVAKSFPSSAVPDSLYVFASTLVLQSLIGLLIGFVVTVMLSAFQIAGSILDLQTGFTMAETFNPELQDLAAPLTQFQYLYALLLFLLANGHHLLIIALTKSFALMPISGLDFGNGAQLNMLTDLTFGALVDGLKIAAPAGAVLLIIDISFAFLSRAMPNFNVYYVGSPVKVIAGIFLILLVLPATAMFAGQLVDGMPDMLSGFVSSGHTHVHY